MTFSWPQFLDVAREVMARTDPSVLGVARERAAISRAYYAVFRRALDVFEGLGEYRGRGDGNDHEALALMLSNDPERRRKKIGQTLHRLRPARRWADYKSGAPPRDLMVRAAVTAIVQADLALKDIEDVAANP